MENILHIVGGASFPAAMGTLNATWPFAILRCNADGISVDLQPHLFKRFFRWFMSKETKQRAIEEPWWSSTWDELSSVRLARKSIVLANIRQKSCKFVTLTRASIEPLLLEFDRRHISVQRVRTNFFYTGSVR